MALQRVLRPHPDRLKLFRAVGHRLLARGHTGDQEGNVEAPRQIPVGGPVREQEDLVGGQQQTALRALRCQRRLAVDRGDVLVRGMRLIRCASQQHAEFLEAFAYRSNGLGQVQVALAFASPRLRVAHGVGSVDSAARKDIGARGEAGTHRAPGHQHLDSGRAVAQQQHGGGRPRGCGFTLRVQKLVGSCHGPILP